MGRHSLNRIKQYVAYYRVSTSRQTIGLQAQETMVKAYLKDQYPPIKSFTEKESGKCDKNRPQLHLALEYCQQHKATLVVATLSRLSRDLHFITSLSKSEIDFVCCDMPDATPLTINLMGAIAQYERETVSKRTKRALAELKSRGVELGANNPKVKAGLEKYRDKQKKDKDNKVKPQKVKAIPKVDKPTKISQADQKHIEALKTLRNNKFSWENIANEFNRLGFETRVCGKWHRTSIKRLADRHNIH